MLRSGGVRLGEPYPRMEDCHTPECAQPPGYSSRPSCDNPTPNHRGVCPFFDNNHKPTRNQALLMNLDRRARIIP
jgi:hypothetical protein